VRSADYFLECGPTTPVAVAWLTDFIGMGPWALRHRTPHLRTARIHQPQRSSCNHRKQ